MSALFDGDLPEEQGNPDADRARRLVDLAFDKSSVEYRAHGADRLLTAAQVFATLASRA